MGRPSLFKMVVSIAAAILAVTPLFAWLGHDSLPRNSFGTGYVDVQKTVGFVNSIVQIFLVIGAIVVFVLTVIEYVKFYKIYKEEEAQ